MGLSQNYKIAKVKGDANWDLWKEDIKCILVLERCWGFVASEGRYSKPAAPIFLRGTEAHTDSHGIIHPAAPASAAELASYQAKSI